VNLGTGEEITIRDLATMIGSELGYTGEIVWDRTKPNGQLRRCVDVSRAQQMFGLRAACSLREGIAKTVAWFLTYRAELREVPFQLMSGQE
jgi:GDP-L-fucose synthase